MEHPRCPKCGEPVPPDARWGICPHCLLQPGADTFVSSFSKESCRFADYELGRQIGRGGMGVVYQAFQVSLRRTVAIKMILDTQASSPSVRRRFAVEAEAAAKLDHPNIVPIYEIGEHEGQPFLSMKLVQGGSLRERITAGDLGVGARAVERGVNGGETSGRERDIVALMIAVGRAVHHANQQGVLHRDLKPANILVDQEGRPHLTDFGLAKILRAVADEDPSVTRSAAILGTPSYMPPEQVSGGAISVASDVYGLGAILYELLTNSPPFRAHTVLETLRLVTDQEPVRPRLLNRAVDSDLETIALKCLEKRPEARYASALDFVEDLERWQRQEPIRARPASLALRARRWVLRNPAAAGLILSLCAGLTAALLLLVNLVKQKQHIELLAGIQREELAREVQALWDKPEEKYVHLSGPKLAELDYRIPNPPNERTLTLNLALSIDSDPIRQAESFAPLLADLEKHMSRTLGRPVLIELQLHKARSWASPAITSGDVEIQRLSVLTYVRLRAAGVAIQPLVQFREHKEACIFASQKSGLTKIKDAAGYRAAFAHTNSIVSTLAKVHLARFGISAAQLKACVNHTENSVDGLDAMAALHEMATEYDVDDYAHSIVVKKVRSDDFDIGVAPVRRFEANRYRRSGLVELYRFPVPSNIFVVRSGLDPAIIRALRLAFLALDDKARLGKIGLMAVGGFEAIEDRDFDAMRQALTEDLNFFERGLPATNVNRTADGSRAGMAPPNRILRPGR